MLTALLLFAQTERTSEVMHWQVLGVDRTAVVTRPAATSTKSPVVFAFHGHGGSSRNAMRSFKLESAFPEAIMVYPQGLNIAGRTDPEGKKPGWQKSVGEVNDRDLKFFDAMTASLLDSRADKSRVYVMGHSNGGAFTYLLWAERGNMIAAIGPSSAGAGRQLRNAKPMPIFAIMGEKDPIVPYVGQMASFKNCLRINGLSASDETVDGLYHRYTKAGAAESIAYIHPGGHTFESVTIPEMVAFFKRHSLGQ